MTHAELKILKATVTDPDRPEAERKQAAERLAHALAARSIAAVRRNLARAN